jgi:hypothetical protein
MSLALSLVAALVCSSGGNAAAPEQTWRPFTAHQTVTSSVSGGIFERRPARESSPAIKALFGSYFALQGADVYSTAAARRAGAREINPVMEGNLGQVMAVKAVTGLTTYYAVNRMARTNKKAAIVTLAILNGVTAAVVVHNMKTARR